MMLFLLSISLIKADENNNYERNKLYHKILSLVLLIRNAPLEKLKDACYLEHELLLQLGLNDEVLHEFPTYLDEYYGKGLKSWQYPVQFSKLLVSLSKLTVNNYLEIGCRHGGTFIIITEYLKRFNPDIRSVAVDPYYSLIMDVYTHDINTNTQYIVDYSTSDSFINFSKQQHWDICFIDGDHSYDGAKFDYNLMKNNSSVLIFHDIVNAACPGVVGLWTEMKQITNEAQREEFVDQYLDVILRTGNSYLGIGVIYQ